MSNQTISEAARQAARDIIFECRTRGHIGWERLENLAAAEIQTQLDDAAARVEPTDKWEIHFERKNTDTNQDEFSIECAGKRVMDFLWTLPQAEAICAARDASFPATPPPQGQK